MELSTKEGGEPKGRAKQGQRIKSKGQSKGQGHKLPREDRNFAAMSRAKIPSFLRILKGKDPETFSYRPRYYDQEKEEREQRRKAIEREIKGAEEGPGYDTEAFRERIRARWKHQNVRGETRRANLRLLIIFALLCMLIYVTYKYLERF